MPAWVLGGISLVSSVIAGNKQAKAGRRAAELQNEATDRQYGYDMEAWEMNKARLAAQWTHTDESIKVKQRNEAAIANYQDALQAQRYNYDMMIRNREQTSLNEQFIRSNDLYNQQIDLNRRSGGAAQEDELRRYQEIQAEAAFENQELILETLINEGQLRARGQTGRSANKIAQTLLGTTGRRQALITESLMSGSRNARSVLKEIARDKEAADMAAFAQKMLDPGVLPLPLTPYETPRAEFMFPIPLAEYDFGPEPVHGTYASLSAASDMGWATALSGIASTAGSVAAGIAGK